MSKIPNWSQRTYRVGQKIPGGNECATREHLDRLCFEYVVRGVTCGIREADGYRARGQYCRVEVTATNVIDMPREPQFGGLVHDKAGREYTDEFQIIDGRDGSLNPGLTARAHVYFDMPPGVRPAKLTMRLGYGRSSSGRTVLLDG
ncbi:hypothetical protein QTQ03_22285 [Micromonospora sp. WMMA1363]|uniref:DUF4352 domain-containing protein n=1 Tax=Micromonospora sp. WMMA1363 TaxID=3053985 RepID=UPI00259CB92A|nr:DUF4352 domain-containing protein [Micromonospora sp. WMMA1363]MDM4722181.1 hypothetical protein [Micromonospora sp. WMMA1363]